MYLPLLRLVLDYLGEMEVSLKTQDSSEQTVASPAPVASSSAIPAIQSGSSFCSIDNYVDSLTKPLSKKSKQFLQSQALNKFYAFFSGGSLRPKRASSLERIPRLAVGPGTEVVRTASPTVPGPGGQQQAIGFSEKLDWVFYDLLTCNSRLFRRELSEIVYLSVFSFDWVLIAERVSRFVVVYYVHSA